MANKDGKCGAHLGLSRKAECTPWVDGPWFQALVRKGKPTTYLGLEAPPPDHDDWKRRLTDDLSACVERSDKQGRCTEGKGGITLINDDKSTKKNPPRRGTCTLSQDDCYVDEDCPNKRSMLFFTKTNTCLGGKGENFDVKKHGYTTKSACKATKKGWWKTTKTQALKNVLTNKDKMAKQRCQYHALQKTCKAYKSTKKNPHMINKEKIKKALKGSLRSILNECESALDGNAATCILQILKQGLNETEEKALEEMLLQAGCTTQGNQIIHDISKHTQPDQRPRSRQDRARRAAVKTSRGAKTSRRSERPNTVKGT